MSIFGLFGRRTKVPDSDPLALQEMLSAAEQAHNPSKALRSLRQQARTHDAQLRLGAPLHAAFRATVEALTTRVNRTPPPQLPSCERVPWSTWEHPTNGAVAERGTTSAADVIYLADEGRAAARDPLAELEALAVLAREGNVAMVTLGEANLFVRRELLAKAAAALDPEAEDIFQDLDDLARSHNWETRFV